MRFSARELVQEGGSDDDYVQGVSTRIDIFYAIWHISTPVLLEFSTRISIFSRKRISEIGHRPWENSSNKRRDVPGTKSDPWSWELQSSSETSIFLVSPLCFISRQSEWQESISKWETQTIHPQSRYFEPDALREGQFWERLEWTVKFADGMVPRSLRGWVIFWFEIYRRSVKQSPSICEKNHQTDPEGEMKAIARARGDKNNSQLNGRE